MKVGNWLQPGQELVFSRGGNSGYTHGDNNFNNNNDNVGDYNGYYKTDNTGGNDVVNDNQLRPTRVPFIPHATAATPQFLECLQRCPTTSEYNPVCASNRQMYGNEQKFNCARSCGAGM